MSTTLYQVDSFTDSPFSGNPAGFCLTESWRSDEWMQNVAAEMNVAETAFLVQQENHFELRWFTPTVEVDLCGHATLSSAHVLWETGSVPVESDIAFNTKSGRLTARRSGDWIVLDFPSEPAAQSTVPGLSEALGVAPIWVGQNRMDILAVVEDESAVRKLTPDQASLSQFDVRGVIVTAIADDATPANYVSRFFAPRVGVPEDPVTGSAHCCLSPYWSRELGKDRLVGMQVSGRGGTVGTCQRGERVELSGKAVTVLKCELF